jgi:hypothetical protein
MKRIWREIQRINWGVPKIPEYDANRVASSNESAMWGRVILEVDPNKIASAEERKRIILANAAIDNTSTSPEL